MTASRNLILALSSSATMREVYGDDNLVAQMIRFEAALALAQAQVNFIPLAAAQQIALACETPFVDLHALAGAAPEAGNLAIPLIKQLTAHVAKLAPEAAQYVHFGATSQDMIDTATMLQARAALKVLHADLIEITASLAHYAQQHAMTTMPGRTWLQHATPVTAGLKAAGWLDALLDIEEKLEHLDARLPLQFGGASGTLAALHLEGDGITDALAANLELRRPDLPWHSARQPVVDIGAALGMLVGTLGKAARDIALLMQNEVAEMSESIALGRGGSSTMAHKRNPVGCAIALAAAQRAPGLVATLLGAMVQEHERGLGGWQAEWSVMPELFLIASAATSAMRRVFSDLIVDQDKMREDLDLGRGVAMAEAATFFLAQKVGRNEAQQWVAQAITQTQTSPSLHFIDALLGQEPVRRSVDAHALRAALQPQAYLGASQAMIARVLKRYRQAQA